MENENRKKIKELCEKRNQITDELHKHLVIEIANLIRDNGDIDTSYIDNPLLPEKMFFSFEDWTEIDGRNIEDVELDLESDEVTLVTEDIQYINASKISINGLLYLIDCIDEDIKKREETANKLVQKFAQYK